MVKIEAIIRPEKMNSVIDAVTEAGSTGYHVVNVTGKGTQQGVEVMTGRGTTMTTRSALPKTLISLVVDDDKKDPIIKAIIESAKSGENGEIGDGKIFVSPISEVIRVRTGETNESAL
tara:strand:+ start:1307 stop:1660 length:354 start_codon:yes stop_codon:yes gene_type:complete